MIRLIEKGPAVHVLRAEEPAVRSAALRFLKQRVQSKSLSEYVQPIHELVLVLFDIINGDEDVKNRTLSVYIVGRLCHHMPRPMHGQICHSILNRISCLVCEYRSKQVNLEVKKKKSGKYEYSLSEEVIYLWAAITGYSYSYISSGDSAFLDGAFNKLIYLLHESSIYFKKNAFMKIAIIRALNRGVFRTREVSQTIWPIFSHIALKMKKTGIPESVKEATEFIAFWAPKSTEKSGYPVPLEFDPLTVLCSGLKEAMSVLQPGMSQPIDLASEVSEFEKIIGLSILPMPLAEKGRPEIKTAKLVALPNPFV